MKNYRGTIRVWFEAENDFDADDLKLDMMNAIEELPGVTSVHGGVWEGEETKATVETRVEKYAPSERKLSEKEEKFNSKKTEIKGWLLLGGAKGWSADQWGNLKKESEFAGVGPTSIRLKFGKTALRLEAQKSFRGGKEWRRIRSEYYGKLTRETLLGWPEVV